MLSLRPALTLGGSLLVATAACSAQPTSQQPPSATAGPVSEPTSLGDYDTSTLTVVRSAFCDRVPDDAITAALGSDTGEGSEVAEQKAWEPGGRLPGTRDIADEFGCAWTAGGTTARAWVFAPPITPERAEGLAAETVGSVGTVGRKCTPVRSAPPLGTRSVAQSCPLNTGSALVGVYGLIGDAWVSCEISGGAEDVEQVGAWCVAVLEAMSSA